MNARPAPVLHVLPLAVMLLVGFAYGQDWEEQVSDQIAAIHDEIAPDFEYASDMVIGETPAGETSTFSMTVHDGAEYIIVAVCDADCGDVDLVIYDPDSEQVAGDIEMDDYPVVEFQGEGDYEVGVVMTDCSADTCLWAAQVFVLNE